MPVKIVKSGLVRITFRNAAERCPACFSPQVRHTAALMARR